MFARLKYTFSFYKHVHDEYSIKRSNRRCIFDKRAKECKYQARHIAHSPYKIVRLLLILVPFLKGIFLYTKGNVDFHNLVRRSVEKRLVWYRSSN